MGVKEPTLLQCENCRGPMRKIKQGNLFDKSNLTIQCILRIIWNFVHHLNETQCKQFCDISTKTNPTVVEHYADCRKFAMLGYDPKLGGFGKIAEMDESYFPNWRLWETLRHKLEQEIRCHPLVINNIV